MPMTSSRVLDLRQRSATRVSATRPRAVSESPSRRLRARAVRAERALRIEHQRLRTCEARLRDVIDEHSVLVQSEHELRAEAGALADELADQREWLEAVLDRMPTPLRIIEMGTGRVAFSNKAAVAMWGDAAIDDPAPESRGPVTDAAGRLVLERDLPGPRAARGEPIDTQQIECHTPQGKRSLVVDTSVMPPFAGRRAMAVVAFTEITSLKEAERSLKESERQFRMLADMVPQMVWKAAPDGGLTYVNQRWLAYSASTREAPLLGWAWVDMLHPEDAPALLSRWQESLRSGSDYEAWGRLRGSDGVYRWHLHRARPLYDAEGILDAWFGTSTDFEDQKRAERALEEANRLKDEFLATMSHELRTPLTAVLGWTRMLRSAVLSEQKRERALESIERNAQAQARLIEDLLDVSRIVSGKLRLNVAPCELVPVVTMAIEAVRPAAEAKGITLESLYEPEVSTMLGDSDRLRQVVWNLVTNAVKFTPAGGRVTTSTRRQGAWFEIEVVDTGQGIRKDFLPHVFERFRQADASTTRATGGLGLGLSVAHQLVELHGGTIAVESEGEGKGARFTVRLPVAPLPVVTHTEVARPRPPRALSRLPELRGVRVLVVDDEADTRMLVASVLEHCKAHVATAGSVAEALELMRRGIHDVLLSDIGMPVEDGLSFIRKVRALPVEQGRDIPAVALTAYARVEDQNQVVSAGFNLHVPKPIDPAELLDVVANMTGRAPRDDG